MFITEANEIPCQKLKTWSHDTAAAAAGGNPGVVPWGSSKSPGNIYTIDNLCTTHSTEPVITVSFNRGIPGQRRPLNKHCPWCR